MDLQMSLDVYLAIIGLIWCLVMVGSIIAKLCRAIRVFLLPRLFPSDLTFYGEWAVVTGGSSGIGKSYAHQLAQHGMNVILISNELDSLQSAVEDIQTAHGVQCCYIHADFTKGLEVYERVMKDLEDKDIGILVNGAGVVGRAPCYFIDETEKNILSMVDLHIGAVINMTMRILPLMLAKKKGIIINISSLCSVYPTVMFSVYSSCKAFMDRFTRALHWEYSKINYNYVLFQSLTPSLVYTRASKQLHFPLEVIKKMATNSDDFASSAVRTIVSTHQTSGYWQHEITCFFLEFFPNAANTFALMLYDKFVYKRQ